MWGTFWKWGGLRLESEVRAKADIGAPLHEGGIAGGDVVDAV
jgi:hypothetical protein